MYPTNNDQRRYHVCVSDPHPILVEGLRRVLEGSYDVTVTSGISQALASIRTSRPDAVILGADQPCEDLLEVIRQVREFDPRVRILFYGGSVASAYVRRVRDAGASGWLLKHEPVAALLEALREIFRGNFYEGKGFTGGRDTRGGVRDLTQRQREVVKLVAQGKSAKMIAADLNISHKTVEFHKAAILQSLQLQSTAQLIRYAIESGMVR